MGASHGTADWACKAATQEADLPRLQRARRGLHREIVGAVQGRSRNLCSFTHTAHTCRSPFSWSLFAHERRLRPRDSPRSSQRPRHYRCRIRTCSPRHARKDSAIKRPERFSLSRTRAAAGVPDGRIIARQQWPSMQFGPQDRRSVASARPSGGLAIMVATTQMIANVPTSC